MVSKQYHPLWPIWCLSTTKFLSEIWKSIVENTLRISGHQNHGSSSINFTFSVNHFSPSNCPFCCCVSSPPLPYFCRRPYHRSHLDFRNQPLKPHPRPPSHVLSPMASTVSDECQAMIPTSLPLWYVNHTNRDFYISLMSYANNKFHSCDIHWPFSLDLQNFSLLFKISKCYSSCLLLLFRKFLQMIILAKSLLPNHAIFQQTIQADGHSSCLVLSFQMYPASPSCLASVVWSSFYIFLILRFLL